MRRECALCSDWIADLAYFKVIASTPKEPHFGSPNLTLINFGEVFNFSESLYNWETFRDNRKTHQRGHGLLREEKTQVLVTVGNEAGWPHLFEEPAGLGDRRIGVPLHGV